MIIQTIQTIQMRQDSTTFMLRHWLRPSTRSGGGAVHQVRKCRVYELSKNFDFVSRSTTMSPWDQFGGQVKGGFLTFRSPESRERLSGYSHLGVDSSSAACIKLKWPFGGDDFLEILRYFHRGGRTPLRTPFFSRESRSLP